MGYLYNGYGTGVGAGWGMFGLFCTVTWLIFTIDGILLGIWLWQKISHK